MTTHTAVNVAPRIGDGEYGAWNVEATGVEGEIEQAIFAGPDAEMRARDYAQHQYGGER